MSEAPASNPAPPTGLLINSRARLAYRLESRILGALKARGIATGPIVRVKNPRGLDRAVATLITLGVTRLIVAGGDGTLGSIVPRLAYEPIDLGVLPLGTANDFARTLGIPSNLEAAADVVARGSIRLVDLAKANDAYFLNVASLGMSVSATAELSAENKRRYGPLAYIYAGMRAFARHLTFRIRVVNGPDSIETNAHQFVVGNGRFYGGGVLVASQSSLEDGVLHAYALGTRGRFQLLRTVALLRMGVPIDRPGDHFLQTTRVEVETWPALPVNCDGEIRTTTPVTFAVQPQALRVFAP